MVMSLWLHGLRQILQTVSRCLQMDAWIKLVSFQDARTAQKHLSTIFGTVMIRGSLKTPFLQAVAQSPDECCACSWFAMMSNVCSFSQSMHTYMTVFSASLLKPKLRLCLTLPVRMSGTAALDCIQGTDSIRQDKCLLLQVSVSHRACKKHVQNLT